MVCACYVYLAVGSPYVHSVFLDFFGRRVVVEVFVLGIIYIAIVDVFTVVVCNKSYHLHVFGFPLFAQLIGIGYIILVVGYVKLIAPCAGQYRTDGMVVLIVIATTLLKVYHATFGNKDIDVGCLRQVYYTLAIHSHGEFASLGVVYIIDVYGYKCGLVEAVVDEILYIIFVGNSKYRAFGRSAVAHSTLVGKVATIQHQGRCIG